MRTTFKSMYSSNILSGQNDLPLLGLIDKRNILIERNIILSLASLNHLSLLNAYLISSVPLIVLAKYHPKHFTGYTKNGITRKANTRHYKYKQHFK